MIDYAEIQAEVQDLEAWKNTAQTLLIDLTKQVDRLEKIVAENKMVIEHQADVMQKLLRVPKNTKYAPDGRLIDAGP